MYSEDYREIKKVFYQWIKAWEENRISDMEKCCTTDLISYISMFEPSHSWEEVKPYFIECVSDKTDNWFEILSYAALVEEGTAQQSANLLALKAVHSNGKMSCFQFSGLFCNSYKKTESGWKISECRFDLFRESGDMSLAPEWNHVNHTIGWFEGIRLPVILGELDAPWIKIQRRDSVGTDEEQIEEAFYRYAFALDTCCFSLMKDVLDDEIRVVMPPFGTVEKPMNKRSFMTSLLTHRHTERFMQHTGEFIRIQTDENKREAEVLFYRKGDSGIEPVPVPEDNIRAKIATAEYQMKMRKDKEGNWRIKELIYEGKSFYYE